MFSILFIIFFFWFVLFFLNLQFFPHFFGSIARKLTSYNAHYKGIRIHSRWNAITVGSVLRGTIVNDVFLLAVESADRGNDQQKWRHLRLSHVGPFLLLVQWPPGSHMGQGGRALAHKTLAHQTLAHRTLAHRALAHQTLAHQTSAHRTLVHQTSAH